MERLISGIDLGFGLGDIHTTVTVRSWDIQVVGFRRTLVTSGKVGVDIAAWFLFLLLKFAFLILLEYWTRVHIGILHL
jgi:hypothetical protein